MYFVDTSALVKAYIPEQGSATVHEAFRRLDGRLFLSDVVAAETLGVFARLLRKGNLSKEAYADARGDLMNHLEWRFRVVPLPGPVLKKSVAYSHLYRERNIGTPDLIHLATAEYLQSIIPERTVALMCADRAMRAIAMEVGFDVFDPEHDPLTNLLQPELDLEG